MSENPPPTGLLQSLRSFGDGLLASAQQRVGLISLELQEEKFRFIQIVIWISAMVFSIAMALLFASLTIVYLFWESARLAVLGGFTLLYAGTGAALVVAFRRYLARQPKPFAATLDELQGDRACIPPGN
jgi:uncharacterized membrane protein YqjE